MVVVFSDRIYDAASFVKMSTQIIGRVTMLRKLTQLCVRY